MKIAVIYARYSSSNQREESIDGQIRVCTEYAEKNGYKVIGTYIDRALSARTDHRPQFLKMIEDSSSHTFDTILVYQLDRFSRSRYDSAIYKHKLKINGVQVVSAKETITDDASGAFFEAILEGYNEFYSKELSQKVKRGMTENALQGKWVSGTVPLGYELTPDKHLKVSPTSKIVRHIFERYANGDNATDIIVELNSMGFKTAKGNKFARGSLHRMLSNEKYVGIYRYHDIVKKDVIEPIITQELFDEVQERVNRQKQGDYIYTRQGEFLLSGKLFCGICGKHFKGYSGNSKGKKYTYYKCNHKCFKSYIPQKPIEDFVFTKTIELLSNEKTINEIADRASEYFNSLPANADIQATESEIKSVQERIDRLVESLELELNKSIVLKIKSLENELEALQARLNVEKIKSTRMIISREQILFFLEKISQGNPNDKHYREMIFSIFVKSVGIFKDKTVVEYNYTFRQSGHKSSKFDYPQFNSTIGTFSRTIVFTAHSFFFVTYSSFVPKMPIYGIDMK